METVAPGAARRFGPRSFRGKIVVSTVGLMTVAMIVVGLFIQLLLSRAAENDVDEVLHQRAVTAVAVIRDASSTTVTVPEDSLEPGVVVYDSHGEVITGSVGDAARGLADRLARELAGTDREQTRDGPGGVTGCSRCRSTTPSGETRRAGGQPGHHAVRALGAVCPLRHRRPGRPGHRDDGADSPSG